jgi:hypothetical protein
MDDDGQNARQNLSSRFACIHCPSTAEESVGGHEAIVASACPKMNCFMFRLLSPHTVVVAALEEDRAVNHRLTFNCAINYYR